MNADVVLIVGRSTPLLELARLARPGRVAVAAGAAAVGAAGAAVVRRVEDAGACAALHPAVPIVAVLPEAAPAPDLPASVVARLPSGRLDAKLVHLALELALAVGRPRIRPPDGAARVLVVDDAPLVRRAMQRALHGAYRVEVDGPAGALERVARSRYELVLIDLHLRALTGRELYDTIRARHPERVGRFAFLAGAFPSGQGSADDLAFVAHDGHATIRKPVGADELRERIAALLR